MMDFIWHDPLMDLPKLPNKFNCAVLIIHNDRKYIATYYKLRQEFYVDTAIGKFLITQDQISKWAYLNEPSLGDGE